MLFRKDIEPCCAYCKHGDSLTDEQVACIKLGIVPTYSACPKFRYDPLKRKPERPRKMAKTEDDESVFRL